MVVTTSDNPNDTNERTPLLHNAQADIDTASEYDEHRKHPMSARQRFRAQAVCYVLGALIYFAHYASISSLFDMVRALACSEAYATSASWSPELCKLPAVEKRTSAMVTSIIASNSLSSSVFVLVFASRVLSRLGRRPTFILSLFSILFFHLAKWLVPVLFAHRPTLCLNLTILIFLLSGLVGSPDSLSTLVGQAVVLDASLPSQKTVVLSRLTACNYIGMALSFVLLRIIPQPPLPANDFDRFPLFLSVVIASIALLVGVAFLPETVHARPITEDQEQPAQPAQATTMLGRLRSSLSAFAILRPTRSETTGQRDWRLARLMAVLILGLQIGLSTNTLVIYLQSRMDFRVRQLNAVLGGIGTLRGIFLFGLVPYLVLHVRRFYAIKGQGQDQGQAESASEQDEVEQDEEQEDETTEGGTPKQRESAHVKTDKAIACTSLVLEAVSWLVIMLGGLAISVPLLLVGLVLFVLSGACLPSVQALAIDVLFSQQTSHTLEEFLSLVNGLSNILGTLGPVVNNVVYDVSIDVGFPEAIFLLSALYSILSLVLVASVRIAGTDETRRRRSA